MHLVLPDLLWNLYFFCLFPHFTGQSYDKCFLGSSETADANRVFCGQLGAIYVFSEALNPAQIFAIHQLGPGYKVRQPSLSFQSSQTLDWARRVRFMRQCICCRSNNPASIFCGTCCSRCTFSPSAFKPFTCKSSFSAAFRLLLSSFAVIMLMQDIYLWQVGHLHCGNLVAAGEFFILIYSFAVADFLYIYFFILFQ